jgi:hypothetical protein
MIEAISLSVAAKLIANLAEKTVVSLTHVPAVNRAIAKTSEMYPSLNDLDTSLQKWCDSDQFKSFLKELCSGSREINGDEIMESFIESSGFYDGENTVESARKVISSLFQLLEKEYYSEPEATLFHASREEVLHARAFEAIQKGLDEQNRISESIDNLKTMNALLTSSFPTALVDKEISEELDALRMSRFFVEFDAVRSFMRFAGKLLKGELSGGSVAQRCIALAWCARVLSRTGSIDKAETILEAAKSLGTEQEVDVAQAFICSQNGDESTALNILAKYQDSLSRSAAFLIVAHHRKPEQAFDWMKHAGLTVTDLDSDGKFYFVNWHLELGNLETAKECIGGITDEDFGKTPALNHVVAMTLLVSTVPSELRSSVLKQLPFEAATFPLASDTKSIEALRAAHHYFIEASNAALKLNCLHAARMDEDYALWVRLRDPDESAKAREGLEQTLRKPESALHLVNLGLQFGVKIEPQAVEREINRQIALHGGVTPETATARFALAFTQKTLGDFADYIDQHLNELSNHFDKKSLQLLQIEILSKAKRTEKATECLNSLLKKNLPDEEASRLRRIIAEAEGADPIESRKEQFKKTDSIADLVSLVNELEIRHEWHSLCEFGQALFDRTRSLQDAERLAIAFYNTGKNESVIKLIGSNPNLPVQSGKLQLLFCWALYDDGKLIEARAEFSKQIEDWNNPKYRALTINLAIALGDWNSLSAFLAKECLEKENRSDRELIESAQLALRLNLPQAKELLFAAVEKYSTNAHVLAAAYFIASHAGWEDDAEVSRWLLKAAELSTEDGPIKRLTLKEVLDRKPEWDRRQSEIWELLNRGDIPIFLAAQSLNKSLIELILFPALMNISKQDPRRRGLIPAYCGNRKQHRIDNCSSIGLDATALLTLSFLNLLEQTFDAFNEIHLPHPTLMWLFDEKHNAVFHQPSRIRDAYKLSHLLAIARIEGFKQTAFPNSDLAAQVGDSLAQLIAEAQKKNEDGVQRIVVRPSPVHRLSSLMGEEADLATYSTVLSSCQAIVEKLRQKGQVTAEEEKRACAYLQMHEKPWPNQPEISDGAILFLDELAVTYLLHLGMLEKLQAAGFRAIIPPSEISESNELISFESISGKVIDSIEQLRLCINSRIESGKIKIGKRTDLAGSPENSISGHPTLGVIPLARSCDAIVVDDRSLNQHAHIDEGGRRIPVISTLDILDALVARGFITPEARMEFRTKLRRAGYIFIPVTEDELSANLEAATIENGKVVESAELKSIRESILHVRMSKWLQLPKEALWLDTLTQVFVRVLKSLWRTEIDSSSLQVRSDWLADQIDVCGWVHCIGGQDALNILKAGRSAHIMAMLTPRPQTPKEMKKKYWNWSEKRILAPIKEQDPHLYSIIVELYRKHVVDFAETDFAEEKKNEKN